MLSKTTTVPSKNGARQCVKQDLDAVEIQITLLPEEAWAMAQFLKRAGHSDYRRCASSDDEAYDMRYAMERIQRALIKSGFDPR